LLTTTSIKVFVLLVIILNNILEYDMREQFNRERNGSLYDRGRADSYYGRLPEPHWYPAGTHKSQPICELHLTDEEIAEYMLGYKENTEAGNFKDWG
jgi:hypothetical protein